MYQPIEKLEVYSRTCRLSDQIYGVVARWNHFQQNTIGTQLCRSADSVGANLVGGDGRESQRDNLRFFDIARSSCRETQYWIERALARGLLDQAAGERFAEESAVVGRMITGLIQRRRSILKASVVRESDSGYDPDYNGFGVDEVENPEGER